MYSYLIKNAKIVDGTGSPSYMGDVAIKDDEISAVGKLDCDADVEIDAQGMLLTPGFIDIHCHAEGIIFHPEKNYLRVLQGITSEVTGNCGISTAPVNRKTLPLLREYTNATYDGISLPFDWETFPEFLESARRVKPILNFSSFVGHGTIRIAVMGFESRVPTEKEMDHMKRLLRESLQQGALGLSIGLIYPPGVFAETSELIELAKVVKEENKLVAVHMRNESDEVVESVKEIIAIAEATGVKMQVSHHKIAGLRNRGKSDITLKMVEDCKKRGFDIALDAYPYNSGCTQLCALLPPWVHEGGTAKLLERLRNQEVYKKIQDQIETDDRSFDNLAKATSWDKIVISNTGSGKYVGMSIEEIAKQKRIGPIDCVLQLLIEEKSNVVMILFTMSDYDVEKIIKCPLSLIATDGVPSLAATTHPRYLGSFIRVLTYYCKEKKLLTLEEAVSKMTYKVAQRCEFNNRGIIEAGKKADIVLMDIDNMTDVTTYQEPQATNPAIRYVWVNGRLAVDNHIFTGTCSGEII